MLVELSHLKKIYHEKKKNACTVLKDVSLQIETGEMIAIMGKSGSGKSTLLNILGCLDTQTAGCYLLDGESVGQMDWDTRALIRNRRIGFVMQDFGLIEYQTVWDNLLIPLYFNETVRRQDMRQLCLDALRQTGMEGRGGEKVSTLSGGEKQRVAIARALINSPSLILADEPTGALDQENTDKILALLQQLHHAGRTIVIVTHDQQVADACDKTYKLVDGSLI